jgi:hypothetical protein
MTTESAPVANTEQQQQQEQIISPTKKQPVAVETPAPAVEAVDQKETSAAVAAEADKAPAQEQEEKEQPEEEMDGGVDADTLEISADDITQIPVLEDEGRRALTLNQYEEAIEKLGKAATIV